MSSPRERGELAERMRALRLAAGNALFGGALTAIVTGAWLGKDPRMLTLGIVGGIVLFALTDLVAPPDKNT